MTDRTPTLRASLMVLIAIACTIDMKKKDAEIKLIIGCTEEEIGIIEEFHNSRYQSAIIIRREED